MARVLRCDICGNIVDEYPSEKFIRISVLDKKSTGVYGNTEMDCCPKCSAEILNFMDIMKTYPDRWCVTILDEE